MVARVLVVEDEDAIRDPLAAALRGAGHEVRECADGAGFEDVVDTFRPDLALLDVQLPGGRDGFALARALRGRSDCAVLMVTARDAVDDRVARVRRRRRRLRGQAVRHGRGAGPGHGDPAPAGPGAVHRAGR